VSHVNGRVGRRGVGLFLAGVVLAGSARGAASQEVVARASAGYGFRDGYEAAVGGSLGIQFPFIRGRTWFLGARVMYHGGTDMVIPESLGGTGESGTVSQLQYGIEFGATWVARPIIVRTSGGIGIARISPDAPGLEAATRLLLGPGLLLAVPIGNTFVGVEAKWLRVHDFSNALALYGTAGIHFGGG
jgi:hypothetical protein